MKSQKIILLCTLFLGLALPSRAQNPLPAIQVKDINGKSRYLSEYISESDCTLFVFWRACCPNTLGMLSELYDVWTENDPNNPQIEVVLVSVDDSKSRNRVRPFVNSNGYPWEVIMDSNMDLARIMNITMPPQWIAYNAEQGEIFRCKITSGTTDSAIYFKQIQQLLKDRQHGD